MGQTLLSTSLAGSRETAGSADAEMKPRAAALRGLVGTEADSTSNGE